MADSKIIAFRKLKWGAPQRLEIGATRNRRRGFGIEALAAVIAVGALLYVVLILPAGGFAAFLGLGQAPGVLGAAQFSLCSGSAGRNNCIVDGDTFHYDGLTIRIADIDTPEVHDSGCDAELALGLAATDRLLALMNAGPFELRPADRDEDRYGRKLRTVWRDGASLGATLVDEGLARVWDGARHPWCFL